jgi:hypothetical protein
MSAVLVAARFTHKHSGVAISGLPAPCACPFCGRLEHVTIDWAGAGYRGDCYRCGAAGPFGATPLEAARQWNSRDGRTSS